MIRIAQAASSEFGTKWGVPPNQRRTPGKLDGELNVVKFTTNDWTFIYRPVKPAIAERIAWIMERAVANGDYIGYGQNNGQYPRTGVFDELMKMGKPDPMDIRTLVNCDCSSLVGAACYFAGVYVPDLRDMYTGSQRDILRRSGEFVEIQDKPMLQSAKGIRRGDVLWKQGHTAVCIDTDDSMDTVPCRIHDCVMCNVRTGPGTEYKILKQVPSGKRVEMLSRAGNGWMQVYVDGGYGYVSPKYCAELPTMTATFDVWLRKDAGTKAAKIIVIPKGASVYVTGMTKMVGLTTWHECVYAGRDGMASGRYLK